jgi:hypothetical protein
MTARAIADSSTTPAPVELIPSLSLEALLARREAAVARLRTIAQAVKEYQDIGSVIWGTDEDGSRFLSAPYTFREPVDQRPSGRGEYLSSESWLEASIKAVDAALWDHLLDRSGLRTFLDSKARHEWHEQIEKRQTPPLTAENIAATFGSLHARRGEFFERGVLEVFRKLSWDYATNQPQAFGKRIILRGIVTADGWPSTYGGRADSLEDLERAFCILDGRPEPDHRRGISTQLWHRQPRHAPIETAYMRIRTFKNGNGHAEFLRPELVDELNRILAKHQPKALPAHL